MLRNNKVICRRGANLDDCEFPSSLHPVLARVYAARNIRTADEIESSLTRLLPPESLSGIQTAVRLLADAIESGQRIMFVADFDADGATSCALGIRALRRMGAADVRYVVPNRFEYGYGLTPEIVALAAREQPDLIVTVDNGISSNEGVRAARARGIKVLITDHHLPGAVMPAAEAIVNPNQPGDRFPSKNLAGVGVIFYVMSALRAELRSAGWFGKRGIGELNLAELLDFVALGTVADVVPLDHNNRILVAQGIKRINSGRCCAGIQALCRVAGKRIADMPAMSLGFIVAPRLNAAGRLEDMSLGIECLLTDDPQAAMEMASRLDHLNRERRAIEAQMQEQALLVLGGIRLEPGSLPLGICLYDASWHQGVIGLVAARIKERLHRPVIAFAPAGNDTLKGSARSVPGLHIRDALDAIAARFPHLLQKFGGHAMAAGLTLSMECLDEFRSAFNAEVGRHLNEDALQGKILSDGELAVMDMDLELARQVRAAGPWGQDFPEPVFDGCFDILEKRIVGGKHLKFLLRFPQAKKIVDAIAFNQVSENGDELVTGLTVGTRVQLAYKLNVNDYQGNRSLQLIVEHLQPLAAAVTA